jgi:hypothetical protein
MTIVPGRGHAAQRLGKFTRLSGSEGGPLAPTCPDLSGPVPIYPDVHVGMLSIGTLSVGMFLIGSHSVGAAVPFVMRSLFCAN